MIKCKDLRIQKEKILRRWEDLSHIKFPNSNGKSRVAIRDHLPQVFDVLCEILESGEYETPTNLGKVHGQQRFSFGDYSLGEVMGEYSLLKNVIYDAVATEATFFEIRLIDRFFDSACAAATVEFANLREMELKKDAAIIAAKNADLELFAAITAHDLRSPAATIVGFSDLLIEDASREEPAVVNGAATIKKTALRMLQLIDQLLQYSKLGSSHLVVKKFSLMETLDEAKANLAQQILDAKAEIHGASLPNYSGDPILFTQLFQNILSNSLKFRSEDRHCIISVESKIESETLTIHFNDNGLGFNPQISREIFEPFKRGDDQKTPGSGLGLATSKRIVELHGGRISAHGRPGLGAEIRVELPWPQQKTD